MAFNTSEKTKQIIVIDKNGNLKLINAGEPVLPGEIVIDSESGDVSVEATDSSQDINEILNAISDGEDPSLVTEAPAAGEEGGSSLTASTEIERVGKITIAETNFDTSSLETIGLSQTQSLTLLEQYKVYRETGEFQVPDSSIPGKGDTNPTGAPIVNIEGDDAWINAKEAKDGVDVTVEVNAAELELGGSVSITIDVDGTSRTVTLSNTGTEEAPEYTFSEDGFSYDNGVIRWTENGLTDGDTLNVDATQKDKAGNESLPGRDEATLDTTAPGKGVDEDRNPDNDVNSIQFVDGDDVLNSTELSAVDLTGKVEADGTLNSIIISGKNVNDAVVTYTLKEGEYSVDANGVVTITDLNLSDKGFVDGALTVEMSVTDTAGNMGSVSDEIALDITAPGTGEGDTPENSIQFVDGDDVLNSTELSAVDLTGKVEADGTLNSIIISGKDVNDAVVTYTLKEGEYSVDANGVVTITDLNLSDKGFVDGALTVDMSVTDKADNTGSVSDEIALDITAPGTGEGDSPENSIQFVDGDDVLNSTELSAVDLTGKVEADGTLNSIIISGKDVNDAVVTYTLKEGEYSVDANGVVTITDLDLSDKGFVDGALTVEMSVTDKADNMGSVSDEIALDITAPGTGEGDSPENSIQFVDGDDVLNSTELSAVDLTGKVEADGTLNSIIISGKDVNDAVVTYTLKEGEYSVDANGVVTITDLDLSDKGFVDGALTVEMSVTDKADNMGSVSDEIALDITAPGTGEGDSPENSIQFVDGDDVLNSTELSAVDLTGKVEADGTLNSIIISGKNVNDAVVTYTLKEGEYSVDANGVVTITDLNLSDKGFVDGALTVEMSVTDTAGNMGSVSDEIALDLTAPGTGEGDTPENQYPICGWR
ncbi:Ig-like domain repeat protein [Aliivibrio salmonicida]|uniref:Ig-like domain repeat protein n=1 Tax=Aliivibrio salmonicida TaxID=40269 RepID=UPI00406D115B